MPHDVYQASTPGSADVEPFPYSAENMSIQRESKGKRAKSIRLSDKAQSGINTRKKDKIKDDQTPPQVGHPPLKTKSLF